ncbi:hypothetical protein C482_15458 [Natrialba chahannaoensis JCM 10990]|uniref:Uncharacterized protein n=1 Tax=Natrialba chahannaoensis JCM 10990 TaxID=1227492 RepID=M0AGZ0_9EURY|nr:hypothetical protein [Natrialba chahannaoensis]ELY96638.1 hypothetical protein C482_15458 [Natrialba chahannaoensis JCM 10990]
MNEQEIKNEIVNTMLHKRIIGNSKAQVTTVVGRYAAIPSHAEGRAKELVDELVQEGIVERYGGSHRANIRLADADIAVEYLKKNDGDIPFGFD